VKAGHGGRTRAGFFARTAAQIDRAGGFLHAGPYKPWEEKVRAYTKTFRASQDILNSIVTFSALAQNAYLVNTEGTQLQSGQIRYRLELFHSRQGTADGMNIERYYNFDWVDAKDAPSGQRSSYGQRNVREKKWKAW